VSINIEFGTKKSRGRKARPGDCPAKQDEFQDLVDDGRSMSKVNIFSNAHS
jgi:hypothetical protein